MKTYELTVSEVRKEIKEAVSVWFDLKEDIRDDFKFLPGMHINVILPELGVRYTRTYSMITNPLTEKSRIGFCTKRVKDGTVSNYINDNIVPGDTIEVMAPMGDFYINPEEVSDQKYIFFAGGSGITPIYSMIQTLLELGKGNEISLYYFNRNENTVIFKRPLEELAEKHKNFLIKHIYSVPKCDRPGFFTNLSEHDEKEMEKRMQSDYRGNPVRAYMCGPGPMMDCIEQAFSGVTSDYITLQKESFAHTGPVIENPEEEEVAATVSATLDGAEQTFEVVEGEPILQAAERAGMSPPYSCRAGQCATCRCKLIEGEITMLNNEVLDDEDIEEGYRLTCVGIPKTKDVKIEWED